MKTPRLLKTHTTSGLRWAIHGLREEWRLSRRHRQALKRVPRLVSQVGLIKLNLGCGPNLKPGWVNIDLFHSPADLTLDLREPWPFPDQSVTYIYSEHVLEHFEFHREVPHFLSEAKRVLCSGGTFDVGVPDSEWPIRSYGNAEDEYWRFVKNRWHPAWCDTQLDHINYHFRQDGEHKYAWDAETLARSLRQAGFAGVARREFDSRLDSESRRIGTLYMRGMKPSP
jgi:predicted SAM-dependent methyltransferase